MNIEPRLPEGRQDIDPEQIAGLLTLATEQMDRDTVEALRRARYAALDRQNAHAPAYALDSRHGLHLPVPHTPRQWMAAVLLLAAVAGSMGYWQHLRQHEMMAHLDVAILTDDMPLEVFIDHSPE